MSGNKKSKNKKKSSSSKKTSSARREQAARLTPAPKLVPQPKGPCGRSPEVGGWQIQEKMGLSKRTDKYLRIVHRIHQLSYQYLKTKYCYSDQRQSSLLVICNLMVKRYPTLGRFVDTWPVRKLIQQFLNNCKDRVKKRRRRDDDSEHSSSSESQSDSDDDLVDPTLDPDSLWGSDPGANPDPDDEARISSSSEDEMKDTPVKPSPKKSKLKKSKEGHSVAPPDTSETEMSTDEEDGDEVAAMWSSKKRKNVAVPVADTTANNLAPLLAASTAAASTKPKKDARTTKTTKKDTSSAKRKDGLKKDGPGPKNKKAKTSKVPPSRKGEKVASPRDLSEDDQDAVEDAAECILEQVDTGRDDEGEGDGEEEGHDRGEAEVRQSSESQDESGEERLTIQIPGGRSSARLAQQVPKVAAAMIVGGGLATTPTAPRVGQGPVDFPSPLRNPSPVRKIACVVPSAGSHAGSFEALMADIDEQIEDEHWASDPDTVVCPVEGCYDEILTTPSASLLELMNMRRRMLKKGKISPMQLWEVNRAICSSIRHMERIAEAREQGWPTKLEPLVLAQRVELFLLFVHTVTEAPKASPIWWVINSVMAHEHVARMYEEHAAARALMPVYEAVRVGYYGEQGEAIIDTVLHCLCPTWELERHADKFAPYSPAAFRHLILVPDMAMRLIAEDPENKSKVKGNLSRAYAIMASSSDYGYNEFQLDGEDNGEGGTDPGVAAQRDVTYKVLTVYRRRLQELKAKHETDVATSAAIAMTHVSPYPQVADGQRATRANTQVARSSARRNIEVEPVTRSQDSARGQQGNLGQNAAKENIESSSKAGRGRGRGRGRARARGGRGGSSRDMSTTILNDADFPEPANKKRKAKAKTTTTEA
ncbi:hypothetical protein L227DRAFT_567302 [Lentinus tigrinus ALCF2SS1-6]|uniref:Restriction of telomere capping protein 4 C-terminal domain-containing protein n=1 Tax=Lentinus tigrinus ALCF2SS1-6 TaxID=1328759 RepID=A0A5C2RVV7_9APHY|nr:hypothetical protein L227DRAFT_567302 [Lentinus tigrinus ALCF2SS1-6]